MAVLLTAAALLAVPGIYPEGHFDSVTKITQANIDSTIKENIDAGKTLFAPAWNRATALFANNSLVAFGDVNLAEDRIGGPYQAGAGGWPTVRYFNSETGVGGAPYVKKTGDAMCTELGNDKYMNAYITEAGSTSLCVAATGDSCNEKEVEFVEKWKGKTSDELKEQITRLRGMASKGMKPDLKQWLGQRLNVLVQLEAALATPKDEL